MATSVAKGKEGQTHQTHQTDFFFFYQKDIWLQENCEKEKPMHDE